MSSVGLGIATAVGLGVGLAGCGIVTLLRRGAKAELRRADRFAKEQDLWLPAELVPAVGARLRVRTGVGLLVSALIGAPLFGWYLSMAFADLDGPATPGRVHPFQGPMVFAFSALPIALANGAVLVWDVARAGRRSGPAPVHAPRPARLADVVPPWLTRLSRGLTVAGPLLVTAGCVREGRSVQALLFGGLALVMGLLAWAVERGQLRVLNAPRGEVGGPELAFDDAFRVVTVLQQVTLAPMLGALAGVVCLELWPGSVGRIAVLYVVWMGLLVGGTLVLNAVVASPRVRRYYRRRLPLSRASETAPC